jgi:hypothetical protein
MTQARTVLQMAAHMRELADEATLPVYFEKLSQAADDLEQRAAEMEAGWRRSNPTVLAF